MPFKAPSSQFLLLLIGVQLCLYTGVRCGWSEWGAWTDCSRTCGGGATYQMRDCHGACAGERIRYKVCNYEPCPEGSLTYRAVQCASYNDLPFKNTWYEWVPHDELHTPCALYCKANGFNLVVKLAAKARDGTRCHVNQTTKDMCVSGRCVSVGCDNKLGSVLRFDKCGVCGGDNSTCRPAPAPDYQWKESGFSRCSVTCGIGVRHSTSLCTDLSTRAIVDPILCALNKPPAIKKQTCNQPACLITKWSKGHWLKCTKSCGTGSSQRFVYCTQRREDGFTQHVHDSYCTDPKPASERACNTHHCPVWYAGEWSPCTATCGDGFQYREVICRHRHGEKGCDDEMKPEIARKCSANLPCLRKIGLTKSELKLATGKTAKHKDIEFLTFGFTPRFIKTQWSPCSATCGFGTRSRTVECKYYLKYLKRIEVLPDEECRGIKPREQEECFEGFCNDGSHKPDIAYAPQNSPADTDYTWRYAGFTPCSKTCLRGRQDSLLECVRTSNSEHVNGHLCVGVLGLPAVSRVCNDIPCPPQWRLGTFGSCSERCGGGVKRRVVECMQRIDQGEVNNIQVPDAHCQSEVPEKEQLCNRHACPPAWAASKWLRCSVTCGSGVQKRIVLCQKRFTPERFDNLTESHCPGKKPHSFRQCGVDCSKVRPQIRMYKETFMQFEEAKRIVVRVGGTAIILPMTTIVVRCSVKYFNRTNIYWLRSGERVSTRGRIKVLKNGSLRVRRSREPYDAGIYTCVAGKTNATVDIRFHSKEDAEEKLRIREKFLSTKLEEKSLNVVTKLQLSNRHSSYFIPADQPAVKDGSYRYKPTQTVVITGQWSDCSKTCGGVGFQTRSVTCEEATLEYTRIRSLHICRKHGRKVPPRARKCKANNPCPEWWVGEWSPCHKSECLKDGYSLQKREIYCQYPNGTSLAESKCNQSDVPVKNRECPNHRCQSVWKATKWSECLPECSPRGVQTRMLFCFWSHSDHPAGISCRNKAKPSTKVHCTPAQCPADQCRDNSITCPIVARLRMCRYETFATKCCSSCAHK